jgi:diguanylate cyclase (GGDEF)-like protein
VHTTPIPLLPDGLTGGLATVHDPGTKPPRSRAGLTTQLRLAARVLDHLPSAVAVLDRHLRLQYWNLHAAGLFNLPPMMQVDAPDLSDALQAGGRLTARQIERITDFCAGVIDASAHPDPTAWLRVSLGRQHRIAFKLHSLGGGRWILGIEELHPASPHIQAGGDAMIDALTGLSNRRHFNEVLENIVRAADPGTTHAVVLLDLDRFKTINDTLGHPVGDALLCLVAQRLRRETRDEDLVAHLGGDEFAILQPNGEQAETLAARIVDIMSHPFLVEGHVANIGASVGIARYPDHGDTADTLMSHADLALYGAKAGGRSTWRLFDAGMAERALRQRELENDLRGALASGELSLAYQPQFNVRTRRITGFEALLRWTHPTRGQVPPLVFIPIAEDIGCIQELGDWVLTTACAQAASWPEPLSIAVNVSPRQLANGEHLFKTVQTALHTAGLPASRLELELTESCMIAPRTNVLDALHRLRALGVRIAMDDFGTGYSSLSQLRAFPFDKIKIDRSFVATLGSDAEAAAVIKAITTLGTGLGMTTIAEGVETAEQAERVAADGCSDIQGYLISRPVPATGIDALLKQYPAGLATP